MKKLARIALFLTLFAVFAAALSGCKNTGGTGSESGGVKTIAVGTGTSYKPYCYLDDDGNLAGYEYEVLKAVDKLLPQYEFKFETFDFKNILLSIDSGKIDIGAHQFEENPDRVKNYLFGEEAYTTFIRYITVDKGRSDIKSIDDLGGKHVYAAPGDNATYFFQAWNEEHKDKPMILDVVEGVTTEELLAGLKSKKWDAYSATKRDVAQANEQYGDSVKTVGEPHINSNTYFVFKKGNTELQEAVDGAVKELKSNGELAQLSIGIIGSDYTENE